MPLPQYSTSFLQKLLICREERHQLLSTKGHISGMMQACHLLKHHLYRCTINHFFYQCFPCQFKCCGSQNQNILRLKWESKSPDPASIAFVHSVRNGLGQGISMLTSKQNIQRGKFVDVPDFSAVENPVVKMFQAHIHF